MKTEKVTGRIGIMTVEELFAFHNALPKIMNERFDEKSAYRIGKLQRRIRNIIMPAEQARLALFELYGKKDGKGNLTILQPGAVPIRAENEADEAFNQRIAEYEAINKNNEEFQKEMAELFKKEIAIEILPITFPSNFSITPADRMALSALWNDEDDATDAA